MQSDWADRDEQKRVKWGRWLLDIVCWDGLFPMALSLTAFVAGRVFGDVQVIREVLMVVLPITGVFTRFVVGYRKIRSNSCSGAVRTGQVFCLIIAVVIFMVVDFFVVLGAFAQELVPRMAPEERPFFILAGLLYLSLVTFAMFPGLETVRYRQESNWEQGAHNWQDGD